MLFTCLQGRKNEVNIERIFDEHFYNIVFDVGTHRRNADSIYRKHYNYILLGRINAFDNMCCPGKFIYIGVRNQFTIKVFNQKIVGLILEGEIMEYGEKIELMRSEVRRPVKEYNDSELYWKEMAADVHLNPRLDLLAQVKVFAQVCREVDGDTIERPKGADYL